MVRRLVAATMTALCALSLAGCEMGAVDQVRAQQQQELVDRATLAAQDLLNPVTGKVAARTLRKARAVMICPRVFRVGFLFGGEGGGCVLLARGGNGSWSAPAFYSLGNGSFGLQAGMQDAELMMMIMTNRGLDAVMDSQFKIGAGASVALVTLGGGVSGDTTAALNADIVAFERTRGLYAGISLEGGVMSADSIGDRAYYNQDIGSRGIVMAMRANNPGADPLRAVLMRFGNQEPAPAAVPYGAAPYGKFQDPGSVSTAPRAAVQQQMLPPPR